jgi:hypothetical protein
MGAPRRPRRGSFPIRPRSAGSWAVCPASIRPIRGFGSCFTPNSARDRASVGRRPEGVDGSSLCPIDQTARRRFLPGLFDFLHGRRYPLQSLIESSFHFFISYWALMVIQSPFDYAIPLAEIPLPTQMAM